MKLDIKALAITAGALWGAAMLIVGLAGLVLPGYGDTFLNVMASVYPGYEPNGGLGQVINGTLYGLVDGAIGGAVFAWIYNRFAGS